MPLPWRDGAERRFLREAMLSLGGPRPGLAAATRAVRRWERLVAMARAGSVVESVGAAIAHAGLRDDVPEPQRTAFSDAHTGAIARNALLLSEAASVQAALAAAGVDSVVLKGPGLLVTGYPDLGARHVADVDLLVEPGDAARADAEIRRRGARPLHAPSQTEHDRFEGHCHLPSLALPSGIVVEIHTAIPGSSSPGLDPRVVLARSRDVSWQGRRLRIPSPADLAAMLCLHVFMHHGGLASLHDRHLADLAVLAGTGGIPWGEIESLVQGDEERWAIRSSRALLERGATGLSSGWSGLSVRTRQMARALTGPGRAGTWRMVLFPSRAYLAHRYDVPVSSRAVLALYLWRPFRGTWRHLTGR